MNAPAVIYAVRWLTWDTFRQALASRAFALLLGVNVLAIVFCLGAGLDDPTPKLPGDTELYDRRGNPLTGPNPDPGQMTFAFGAVRLNLFRDGETSVHFLTVVLGKWIAGGGGLLLALVLTAGFIPEFLQPGNVSVLLTKPAPRWVLIAGKYGGVVLFIALQAVIFFGGTWLALGLRTGVWLPNYLLGAPVLAVHFAVVYGFAVLLGVATRSTIACVFGAVLFWLICFGVNYARHAALALPELAPEAPPYHAALSALLEFGYWMLPKPADLTVVLDSALGSSAHFSALPEFAYVVENDLLDPVMSVFTSMLFAAAALALAARQLAQTDY
jgi:ABC-type transport system involved in multi-copper enzyme maturation permease subunit